MNLFFSDMFPQAFSDICSEWVNSLKFWGFLHFPQYQRPFKLVKFSELKYVYSHFSVFSDINFLKQAFYRIYSFKMSKFVYSNKWYLLHQTIIKISKKKIVSTNAHPTQKQRFLHSLMIFLVQCLFLNAFCN